MAEILETLVDDDAIQGLSDPLGQIGQAIGLEQFVQPMEYVDATGIPSVPFPEAPVVPVEGELGPAAVPQGDALTAGFPEQLVPVKKGSSSTTTETQERSPETIAAEQTAKAAEAEQRAALDQQAAALDKQTEAESKKEEERSKAIEQIEVARARTLLKQQAEFQQDLADIEAKQAELVNMKDETFWGGKSSSDRIAAAISVGLGSFGQAMTGSGQNVGMVLLQRQMDEFDRNQKRKYDARLKEIEGMRTSLDTKRALARDAEKAFDATKLAKLAKIDGMYARGIATAKTEAVKASLAQKRGEISQQAAKIQMDQASKYEQRIKKNTTNDIIEMVKASNTAEGVKQNDEAVKKLLNDNANIAKVRSQLNLAIKQIRDPSIDIERKKGIGFDILKAANSSLGPDVVGADEAARGASELTPSIAKISENALKYGGAGAGAGAAIGAIPTAGIGTPIGAAVGGGLGAVGGAIKGLLEEMQKPGGARLAPDPEAFAQRLETILGRIDGGINNNDALIKLMKRGLTQSQAQAIIDGANK